MYLLLPGIIIAAVLVHLDYYKKVPYTGRLINNRNLFLMVPYTGRLINNRNLLLMVLEVGFS